MSTCHCDARCGNYARLNATNGKRSSHCENSLSGVRATQGKRCDVARSTVCAGAGLNCDSRCGSSTNRTLNRRVHRKLCVVAQVDSDLQVLASTWVESGCQTICLFHECKCRGSRQFISHLRVWKLSVRRDGCTCQSGQNCETQCIVCSFIHALNPFKK